MCPLGIDVENGLGEHICYRACFILSCWCEWTSTSLFLQPFPMWSSAETTAINHPPRETESQQGGRTPAHPRVTTWACLFPLSPRVSNPLSCQESDSQLPLPLFCDQLTHSLQKGLCSRLNSSPPRLNCYHFSGCIQNQKIQEIYSQMFPCLFVDSV